MKKVLAMMGVLSFAVIGTVTAATRQPEPTPEVDEAAVKAKIDARLHELLLEQIARRKAR